MYNQPHEEDSLALQHQVRADVPHAAVCIAREEPRVTLHEHPKRCLKWTYQADEIDDLKGRHDLWAEEYDTDRAATATRLLAIPYARVAAC